MAGILAGFFPVRRRRGLYRAICQGTGASGRFLFCWSPGLTPATRAHREALGIICGFGIAFFYVYQIIDAVRIGEGDPDGATGAGSVWLGGDLWRRRQRSRPSKIPMGAIVLILLGVLFLLHTMGLTEFGLGPLLAVDFDLCSAAGCSRATGALVRCVSRRVANVRAAARGG